MIRRLFRIATILACSASAPLAAQLDATPRLLATWPTASTGPLGPVGPFALMFSASLSPALLARLAASSRIEMAAQCPRPGPVALRVVGQRGVEPSGGDSTFRSARLVPGDTSADRARRIVDLEPVAILHGGCSGTWIVPTFDSRDEIRIAFRVWRELIVEPFNCPDGCFEDGIPLGFTAPVLRRSAERWVSVTPAVPFRLEGPEQGTSWRMRGPFMPRTNYSMIVSRNLHDIFDRAILAEAEIGFHLGDHTSALAYRATSVGRRDRLLAVHYRNVDTVTMIVKAIPDSLRGRFVGGTAIDSRFAALRDSVVQMLALTAGVNVAADTMLTVPTIPGHERDLTAVRLVVAGNTVSRWRIGYPANEPVRIPRQTINGPIVLLDPGALVVHTRIDDGRGFVLATRASDGEPVAGARVEIHGPSGDIFATARTDATGVATLVAPSARSFAEARRGAFIGATGFVDVASDDGSAILPLGSNPDGLESTLESWIPAMQRSGVTHPIAALVLDRPAYHPGDIAVLRTILRAGPQGELAPPTVDSLRLTVARSSGDDNASVFSAKHRLVTYGASLDTVRLDTGDYTATAEAHQSGAWRWVAAARISVTDRKPTDLDVVVVPDTGLRLPGDTVRATMRARDASADAVVKWNMRTQEIFPWELAVPRTEGYIVGGWEWTDFNRGTHVGINISRTDTLGRDGRDAVAFVPTLTSVRRPARVTIDVNVTDAIKRTGVATTSRVVTTTQLYVAARDMNRDPFWRVGGRDSIRLLAVSPVGKRVAGVRIGADVTRRTRVLSERGVRWVVDTVSRTIVVSDTLPIHFAFTPPSSGQYEIRFTALDNPGKLTATSLTGYAIPASAGGLPNVRLDVATTARDPRVGDAVTVTYTSPFPRAEAWILVERDGVIEQQRATVAGGRNEVRLAVTPRYAPMVWVTVLLVAHRPALGGELDQLVRAGYAEVRLCTGSSCR